MARPTLLRAAIACLLALSPAGVVAQPAPDMAILEAAGAGFPERIGEFTRRAIASVEPGRINASYRNDGDALVDIFISRAGMPLDEEFASTEGMIGRVFSDLRAVRDLPPPPEAPTARGRLWTGMSGSGRVLTAMMLDQRGGWRIKIRGTVSQAAGEAGAKAIEQLMRDYGWWR
ncbi:MAG TPA: hypothetical protein VEA61_11290 [Allosphingosinicella sp.]|nr:hypothetical protein [Allosphingosinicella sp.]